MRLRVVERMPSQTLATRAPKSSIIVLIELIYRQDARSAKKARENQ
jgi:hypothetical protein